MATNYLSLGRSFSCTSSCGSFGHGGWYTLLTRDIAMGKLMSILSPSCNVVTLFGGFLSIKTKRWDGSEPEIVLVESYNTYNCVLEPKGHR